MSDVTFFFGGRASVLHILFAGMPGNAALVALQRIGGKRPLSQMARNTGRVLDRSRG